MDDNELVIFRDLPDKTTPLNAYNLNHNFDVYNKKIETEAGKIDTTLQEIEKAKTDMQNDIDSKTQALEKNITEQITKTTENLESQITQSKEQLETDIGKQIASITSLSIEVVESLPTQNISKTTIYLIKPENLPQDMSINSVKKNLQAEKLVISPLSENSVSALAISQEDFYLACFYVNNDWVVVGSTTTDLSGYVKKNELATLETDPTVPSHVKSITMQNISNWNNKIGQTELEQLITNITNLDEEIKTLEEYLKNFTSDYKVGEVCETLETYNGKRVYSYVLRFKQAITKNTEYSFSLPFADQIDFAWVDMGNSFIDGSEVSDVYNTHSLANSTTGYQFRISIMGNKNLTFLADDNWNSNWSYSIRIKFTKK